MKQNPLYEPKEGKIKLEAVTSYKVTWPSGTSSRYATLRGALASAAETICDHLISSNRTRVIKMVSKHWNKYDGKWTAYCHELRDRALRRLTRLANVG